MPYPELGPNLPHWGNAFMRGAGRLILRLMRFRFTGQIPDLPKFVLIGAPHTSNWDFVVGMALLLALGLRVRWLGKHTIFRAPFGGFMRWLGGIPIDRARTEGTVEQAVAAFAREEKLIIGLAPEGTRKRIETWRSGFYRIALGAGVPIAVGVIDFGNRELRVDSVFHPTGDLEADIAAIRARYAGVEGKKPEQFAP
jgi:1-acyl-sn-glycerol-3-phosphate acyltransferase